MNTAGQKLKRARERLNLRYRDVEELSQKIAERRGSDEYTIALSRLADIENKGTLPSLYRLYSLCAIYRLDLSEVLEWYGIPVGSLAADAASLQLERTHAVNFQGNGPGEAQVPLALDPGLDFKKTTYLSRLIQRWGKVPLMLLDGLDLRHHRYAFVGSEDWSMHPLLPPGSLVVVDETRRKIAASGWTSEYDRPIYFLEHREGWLCGWCTLAGQTLIVQGHPSSATPPRVFDLKQIEIVGQITAVAMQLEQKRTRS